MNTPNFSKRGGRFFKKRNIFMGRSAILDEHPCSFKILVDDQT